MRNLPASSLSFRGTHHGGPNKDRAAGHPHGMTDQPSRPDSHDPLLETQISPGTHAATIRTEALTLPTRSDKRRLRPDQLFPDGWDVTGGGPSPQQGRRPLPTAKRI